MGCEPGGLVNGGNRGSVATQPIRPCGRPSHSPAAGFECPAAALLLLHPAACRPSWLPVQAPGHQGPRRPLPSPPQRRVMKRPPPRRTWVAGEQARELGWWRRGICLQRGPVRRGPSPSALRCHCHDPGSVMHYLLYALPCVIFKPCIGSVDLSALAAEGRLGPEHMPEGDGLQALCVAANRRIMTCAL